MEKYLNVLNKIKATSQGDWDLELNRVERYIKGEITNEELLSNYDTILRNILYYIVNKVLNYEEKSVRYFIELPVNIGFSLCYPPSIIAAKDVSLDISHNVLETIGPNYMYEENKKLKDDYFLEITGDVSKYPTGIMLYYKDWAKIIKKFPYLYECLYKRTINGYGFTNYQNLTMDNIKEKTDNILNNFINRPSDAEPNHIWAGKEEAEYVSDEFIDSIEFILPHEYITVDEIESGSIKPFDELVNEKEISKKLIKK